MDTPEFHKLADDAPETFVLPDNAPVLMANTPQDSKSVNRHTVEAPCHEEDGKPMDADSFHHRNADTVSQPRRKSNGESNHAK